MGVSSFNGLYVFYETLAEIRFYESEKFKNKWSASKYTQ